MSYSDLVVRAKEVEPFIAPGMEGIYESQNLIDRESVGSRSLNVNRGVLKAGQRLEGGSHPSEYDECYYIVSGRAKLALGGDPETGVGSETVDVEPETLVFIPGGTFHALDNPYGEDLVILTLWPRHPEPGANGLYDARKAAWGTSFRKVAR